MDCKYSQIRSSTESGEAVETQEAMMKRDPSKTGNNDVRMVLLVAQLLGVSRFAILVSTLPVHQ